MSSWRYSNKQESFQKVCLLSISDLQGWNKHTRCLSLLYLYVSYCSYERIGMAWRPSRGNECKAPHSLRARICAQWARWGALQAQKWSQTLLNREKNPLLWLPSFLLHPRWLVLQLWPGALPHGMRGDPGSGRSREAVLQLQVMGGRGGCWGYSEVATDRDQEEGQCHEQLGVWCCLGGWWPLESGQESPRRISKGV